MVDFRVSAVLPAGGCGLRMSLDTPKQFCEILGRPLISYTLEAFERVPWIGEIVVPVSQEGVSVMEKIIEEFKHSKVILTKGGTTRHRSIKNGIEALSIDNKQVPDVVIIHDAVRPFVSDEVISNVTLAAKEHGAAGVIRPLISTVIATTHDGFLDHSLDRTKYKASEMPQAFAFSIICEAYKKCTSYEFDYGTECLHLALTHTATRAKLITGGDSLWKVTYKKDLYAAEGIIKGNLHSSVVIMGESSSCFVNQITERVKTRGLKLELEEHYNANNSCGTIAVNMMCSKGNAQRDNANQFMLKMKNISKVINVACSKCKNLEELEVFTRYIAKEKELSCFAVWSAQVCSSEESPSTLIDLIVAAALDTPDSLSGQVFKLLS